MVRVKLTAIWQKGKVPGGDLPERIVWEDGTDGTLDDYRAHCNDTRRTVRRWNGKMEWHIYPEIVGGVYWCSYGRVWGIRGEGIESDSLPLDDSDATDGQIEIALMALPMRYRVRIVR